MHAPGSRILLRPGGGQPRRGVPGMAASRVPARWMIRG